MTSNNILKIFFLIFIDFLIQNTFKYKFYNVGPLLEILFISVFICFLICVLFAYNNNFVILLESIFL